MNERVSRFVICGLAAIGLLGGSGCAALLVGGAAAGGYYVGKDERSAAQIAEDGSITTAVKTRLIGDKYVKAFAIDVDTFENAVTLNGDVKTYIARDRAEEIARNVKGVTNVTNNLRVVDAETADTRQTGN